MNFDFMNPVGFLFLLLIPLFYVFRKAKLFSKISMPLTFSDWGGWVFSWNDRFRKILSVFSEVLCCIAFIFVVLAFCQPVVHHQERVYTSRGTQIIFVVDTSPSMAARDMGDSKRLDAAIDAINKITESNSGGTYGLIAMGAQAAVVVPLTNDIATFNKRLAGLEVGMMGDGTAIGTGLALAIYHINSTKATRKCVVILTDGENNAGQIHPETAAKIAKDNSITLYTVGIGTRGTVPLEYVDPVTGKTFSGYYESNFDSSGLENIAMLANGRYYSVESISSLSSALSSIIKKQDVVQSYYIKTIDENFYDKFLLAALICLGLGWFIKRFYLQEFI